MIPKEKYVSLLLRLGLAFAFIYVAVTGFFQPYLWEGFVPSWMRDIIPTSTFLTVFGVFQLVLGVLLLSGKKVFYAALLSCISLLGIIVPNFVAMEIIFRDITILCSAFALAVMTYEKR